MRTERQTWPIHGHSLYEAFRSIRTTRILLAEDDREMRRLIASTLKKEGYEVVEVSDGNQLLSMIGSQILNPRNHPPADLVISDVRMPGHNGLEVLAGLRHADWSTPVILITAFGDDETHAEARRLGAAAIIDKPFDLNDLKTVVINLPALHSAGATATNVSHSADPQPSGLGEQQPVSAQPVGSSLSTSYRSSFR